MSSSSLGGRASAGWGVAIESSRPVPHITGNASARPFRGELILRRQRCWTPKLGTPDRGSLPTHPLSVPQACREAYIRLQMFFQSKSGLEPPTRNLAVAGTQLQYQPYLPGRTVQRFSFCATLAYGSFRLSCGEKKSRYSTERRDRNESGSRCVDWFSD